jgi:hypothetical protein
VEAKKAMKKQTKAMRTLCPAKFDVATEIPTAATMI